MVNVLQHVQMDNTVIMNQRLVKLVILNAPNVPALKIQIVKLVMMDLIMMDLLLVWPVMNLVQNVQVQNNLNAKDVTVDFI